MIAIIITAFATFNMQVIHGWKNVISRNFFSFLYGKVGDIRDEENLLCGAELGKLFPSFKVPPQKGS